MQLRLLEIELNTDNPEASKRFYGEQLGLKTYIDEDGLKVFDSGIPEQLIFAFRSRTYRAAS